MAGRSARLTSKPSTMKAKSPIKTAADAKAAVRDVHAENKAAETLLQAVCSDPARWLKLKAQALNQGVHGEHFAALCGKMVRTRFAWTHLTTDEQRGLAAFIGLLCLLGSPVEAESEQLTKLLS